jgi:hypothetical protein
MGPLLYILYFWIIIVEILRLYIETKTYKACRYKILRYMHAKRALGNTLLIFSLMIDYMVCLNRPLLYFTPYGLLETVFMGAPKSFLQDVAKVISNLYPN